MGPKVMTAIMGLSNRMLTFKATQEARGEDAEVSQREFLILELLKEKGTMNVSDISEAVPNVSYSTISTDLTRLWRDKKFVSKKVEPENQRVTLVSLTEKGKQAVEQMQSKRTELMNQLYKALNTTKEEEQVLIRVSERATKYFDKLLGINGHKNEPM